MLTVVSQILVQANNVAIILGIISLFITFFLFKLFAFLQEGVVLWFALWDFWVEKGGILKKLLQVSRKFSYDLWGVGWDV